ncbi:MAG: long-chain fatty acid--CoA ligase [Proteobacteria bacterium]|jgi:fatty-acyl-CoA synthase|nr:long-chain fatty acid--CoA ligase [Pseudomonadota bacterium]
MDIKVYDWIESHANQTPDKVAIEDLYSNRSLTYREFHERIARLTDHLVSQGISKGDRIACLSYNNPEMLEMQFACNRLGAIFVPLNFRLTVPELEYIVTDCGAAVMFADVEFAETATRVVGLAGVPQLIITNSDGSDSPYEQAMAAASPRYEYADLILDDIATIMYTSGTTGHPKGALISHAMALFNAVNMSAPAKVTADSVQYTFMPLFHTGGLNVFTLPVLHAGGRVILTRAFDPGEVLRVVGDPAYGVTHLLAVPAMLLFIAQHPDFQRTDFSRIVAGFVGGAPVPVPTLKTFLAAGANLQQGFGMTETGPSCLALMPEDAQSKIGSTGKPVTHIEVRIVDEQGRDVRTGEMGELWVKGPSVTTGYWNKPEANAASFTDGWLHTGDAARQDEDGFYYIVDRTKDMYISGGENVYPAEVEDVIYQIDGIVEAAVIGVADERWGETGKAIAVLEAGSNLTEDAIIAHCAERLAKFKLPKSVEFTDALPRNATGKVLKTRLREQFGDG